MKRITKISVLSLALLSLGLTGCKKKTTTKINTTTAKATHVHSFNQKVLKDEYIKSFATCTTPMLYYYSCICGEVGTESFASGEKLDHVYLNDGLCKYCKYDISTIYLDDYDNFNKDYNVIGNKIYIKLNTSCASIFYIDTELMQQIPLNTITEDTPKLITNIEIYEDGFMDNNLYDRLNISSYMCEIDSERTYDYWYWSSEECFDTNTTYHIVLTLDMEYNKFTMYSDIKELHKFRNDGVCTMCYMDAKVKYDISNDLKDVTYNAYDKKVFISYKTECKTRLYFDADAEQNLTFINTDTSKIIANIEVYNKNDLKTNLAEALKINEKMYNNTNNDDRYYWYYESENELDAESEYIIIITLKQDIKTVKLRTNLGYTHNYVEGVCTFCNKEK